MDVKKHIEKAFNLLRAIPVKEEAVDLMFMAKEELRAAYKILDRRPEGGEQRDAHYPQTDRGGTE